MALRRRLSRGADLAVFTAACEASTTARNLAAIVTPFNGTIPNGEIGINPAYPGLEYTVWQAEQGDAGRLHPTEQLDVTIAPRHVDIQHTLMRNSRSVNLPSTTA